MAEVVISLTVVSQTPLSIGAGGSSGTLADKSIIRDGWGRPIIPASQVKGKIRYTAEALARTLGAVVADMPSQFNPACVVQRIFGAPGKERSKLLFNDLPLLEPGIDAQEPGIGNPSGLRSPYIRPSVSINRRRGTAEDQRLLFQETADIRCVFANPQAIVGTLDEQRDLALLLAALRLTTRWGGAKSRGLGWMRVETQASWDGQVFDSAGLERALRGWGVRQ